jgi:hypothetical protein
MSIVEALTASQEQLNAYIPELQTRAVNLQDTIPGTIDKGQLGGHIIASIYFTSNFKVSQDTKTRMVLEPPKISYDQSRTLDKMATDMGIEPLELLVGIGFNPTLDTAKMARKLRMTEEHFLKATGAAYCFATYDNLPLDSLAELYSAADLAPGLAFCRVTGLELMQQTQMDTYRKNRPNLPPGLKVKERLDLRRKEDESSPIYNALMQLKAMIGKELQLIYAAGPHMQEFAEARLNLRGGSDAHLHVDSEYPNEVIWIVENGHLEADDLLRQTGCLNRIKLLTTGRLSEAAIEAHIDRKDLEEWERMQFMKYLHMKQADLTLVVESNENLVN